MNFGKEIDDVFKKMDELFALSDKLFHNMLHSGGAQKDVPVAEVHTDHVQFRATSFRERRKLFWRFFKMAFAAMFKGVAHLKFKSRAK